MKELYKRRDGFVQRSEKLSSPYSRLPLPAGHMDVPNDVPRGRSAKHDVCLRYSSNTRVDNVFLCDKAMGSAELRIGVNFLPSNIPMI